VFSDIVIISDSISLVYFHHMSVNSCQLSVVRYQLSVMSYQLLLTSVSIGDIRLLLHFKYILLAC